jgi:threonine dehydrogenase-like Zn-dependent dehydrogenase
MLVVVLCQVEKGELAPEMVITHQLPLEQAPQGYKVFNQKLDNCVKVILRPGQVTQPPAGAE